MLRSPTRRVSSSPVLIHPPQTSQARPDSHQRLRGRPSLCYAAVFYIRFIFPTLNPVKFTAQKLVLEKDPRFEDPF